MLGTVETVARAAYEAVNARDLAALDRLYAPELTVNGSASTSDQLKRACQGFIDAFPDLDMTVERLVVGGDWVAVRVVGRGTHTGSFGSLAATGRPIAVAQHDLLRIRDGVIVEVWNLYDQFGMLQQIGAVPVAEPA